MSTKSWGNWQSREHTVYAVYPLSHKAEEVMLHGRSNNVKTTGEKTTFTWAARMHFQRSADGKVLIDEYTIIPVSGRTPTSEAKYQVIKTRLTLDDRTTTDENHVRRTEKRITCYKFKSPSAILDLLACSDAVIIIGNPFAAPFSFMYLLIY